MIDLQALLKRGGVVAVFEACGLAGPAISYARACGKDMRAAWAQAEHVAPLVMVAAHCGVPAMVMAQALVAVTRSTAAELGETLPPSYRDGLCLALERPGVMTTTQLVAAMDALNQDEPLVGFLKGFQYAVRAALGVASMASCNCGQPEIVHCDQVAQNMLGGLGALDLARASHGKRSGRVVPGTSPDALASWSAAISAEYLRREIPIEMVLAHARQLVPIPSAEYDPDQLGWVTKQPVRGLA